MIDAHSVSIMGGWFVAGGGRSDSKLSQKDGTGPQGGIFPLRVGREQGRIGLQTAQNNTTGSAVYRHPIRFCGPLVSAPAKTVAAGRLRDGTPQGAPRRKKSPLRPPNGHSVFFEIACRQRRARIAFSLPGALGVNKIRPAVSPLFPFLDRRLLRTDTFPFAVSQAP